MKNWENFSDYWSESLSSKYLFCKVHFLKYIVDSLDIKNKSICLLSKNYLAECVCKSDNMIISDYCSNKRDRDNEKIIENIDMALAALIHYAEIITISLNISKRKVHDKCLCIQNSSNKNNSRFLLESNISSNIIYSHNELNHKLAKILIYHIFQINSLSSLNASYINKVNFTCQKNFLKCFKEIMTDELREKLLYIVLQSKTHKNIKYAASNAITILNYFKYKFINKDLSGIQIKGADLSEALIINTNFEGSNLKRVNFSYSNIYDSNFRNCDLSDAWFGQLSPVINKCPAFAIAFSWCENYLAYDCHDTVIMHDIKNDTTFREFKHETNITAISFSKDGILVAIADSNNALNIWDIKHMKLIQKLRGHTDSISSIAFSPNGNFIATGSYDGHIRIWDTEAYMLICCMSRNNDIVCSVAYSHCGRYFAFGTFSHFAIVSYTENVASKLWRFNHPEFVRTVSFSPCSKYLITSCDDLVFRTWDLETGYLSKVIKKDYFPLHLLRFSQRSHTPSEDQILSVKFWAKYNHYEIKWFNEQLFNMLSLAYSPNGKYIAIKKGDKSDKALEIWDVKTLEEHASFYNDITSISFSYDGKYIAVANTSKWIRIKNAETKKNEFKIEMKRGIAIFVKFLRFGNFLISLSHNNYITVWDVANQYSFKEFSIGNTQMSAIDISFNEKIIITGFCNGEAKLWDLEIPSNNLFLKCGSELITCIKFSPCGKYFATAWENKLFLWELSYKTSLMFVGHEDTLSCLSFVNSSKYLVSADKSGRVILWDIDTQWKIIEIKADDRMILSMAVSFCGDYLITGCLNGCIKVWNTWEGTLIKELKRHSNAIDSLQFVNNKMFLFASVSADCTYKLFGI